MSGWPWYVLLVPLVPVASMYADTAGAVRPDELARSASAAIAVAAALLGIAWAVYRDVRKAALFVSLALVVFLAFDRVYAPLQDAEIAGFRPARRIIAIPLTYAALAFCAWRIRRIRRPLVAFTRFANVVVAGSLILPAAALTRAMAEAVGRPAALLPLPAVEDRAVAKPDIYYVVFDRYGDAQTAQRYGLDNEPFYRYLEETGFYVARESRSNYVKTILSLASSLNMSYLEPLAEAEGRDSENWWPVYDWVRHARATRFLTSQGYRYVHAGSWYWPTAENPDADRNVNAYTVVPYAAMRLLDSELIDPLRRAAPTPWLDARLQQWHRVRWQIDEIVARAAEPGPTFTFIHVLVPHSPYVFEPDGRYVPAHVEAQRTRAANYANQVLAANAFARRLVDGILARASTPPVIVLQGDEGPYPPGTSSENQYNWRTASSAELREKSGILNAYYFPPGATPPLYPSISPVNTFGTVFNTYFGTRIELLPDRVFGHESEHRPYAFFELTDAVREPLHARMER